MPRDLCLVTCDFWLMTCNLWLLTFCYYRVPHFICYCQPQVGLVDVDICGPSAPKLMKVENKEVVNSQYGWMPPKWVVTANSVYNSKRRTYRRLYTYMVTIDTIPHTSNSLQRLSLDYQLHHDQTEQSKPRRIFRSPHGDIKVMSVGSLLQTAENA